MKAADSGAGQVITCEMERTIASAAKKIVATYGFGQTVTVLNKKSTDLRTLNDLPGRANIVIVRSYFRSFEEGRRRVASLCTQ